MPIEVVLDIFSGRPNPTWPLAGNRAAEWLSRLEALPPATEADAAEPPGLGYRGFVVSWFSHPKCGGPARVFGGVVQCAGGAYRDEGRRLERWLLATAGTALDDALRDVVSAQIAS